MLKEIICLYALLHTLVALICIYKKKYIYIFIKEMREEETLNKIKYLEKNVIKSNI